MATKAVSTKPSFTAEDVLKKTKGWTSHNWIYFVAFLLPVVLTFIAYVKFGIYPFASKDSSQGENGSVLVLDLNVCVLSKHRNGCRKRQRRGNESSCLHVRFLVVRNVTCRRPCRRSSSSTSSRRRKCRGPRCDGRSRDARRSPTCRTRPATPRPEAPSRTGAPTPDSPPGAQDTRPSCRTTANRSPPRAARAARRRRGRGAGRR